MLITTSINPASQKQVLAAIKYYLAEIKARVYEKAELSILNFNSLLPRDRKHVQTTLRTEILTVTGLTSEQLESAIVGLHQTTCVGIVCTTESDLYDVCYTLNIDDLLEQVDNYVECGIITACI